MTEQEGGPGQREERTVGQLSTAGLWILELSLEAAWTRASPRIIPLLKELCETSPRNSVMRTGFLTLTRIAWRVSVGSHSSSGLDVVTVPLCNGSNVSDGFLLDPSSNSLK